MGRPDRTTAGQRLMQQYFIEEKLAVGQHMAIQDKRIVHHVVKVMRMQPGAKFELVSSDQVPYLGTLLAIETTQKQIQVEVGQAIDRTTELPISVRLICGLPKRDKTEWIVQKATELGAKEIIFFGGERSVVRWDQSKAAKKLQRLQAIALEAGEQSHRNIYPTVTFVKNIQAVVKLQAAVKLFAYEESGRQGEHQVLKTTLNTITPGQDVLCLFGPEGGISENEVQLLRQAEFKATGLGPRILRTETAPLYFLSCISYGLELDS